MPRSPRLVMTGDCGSPMRSDFANAVLITRHRPGKFASPLWHRPHTAHVIGKDNPGVDRERWAGAHFPNGVARRIDARHQQVRPTVKQVHCKEERSTRNPIAAIIRHQGSVPELGERRNAACSESISRPRSPTPQVRVLVHEDGEVLSHT
jgi:hypothetical protein